MNTITNLVVALMITTQPCKHCKYIETNFVYSTDIYTPLKVKCKKEYCYRDVLLTPKEFLGKSIESIYFYFPEDYFCREHKHLKYFRHW
jgi:hypothetical protein